MRQPLLDAVRGLDPAADAPEIDAEAVLARIDARLRSATADDVAHLVPRSPSRPARRLAMGAAALSALAALVLVLTLTQRGPQAYASWEPVPTVVPPLSQTSQVCPDVEPSTGVPVEPVLAEQRGSYTFVVLAGEGTYTECLVSHAGDGVTAIVQGTTPADPAAFELGQAPVIVLTPGGSWGAEAGEGPITTVVGIAADDVTAVQVTTVDGTTADAAVDDGWWSVWIPGEVEIADELLVTTPDGESTLSLDALIAPGLG